MKTKIWASVIVVIIILVGIGAWVWHSHGHSPASAPTPTTASTASTPGYENATYNIENQNVTLVNGQAATSSAPGSVEQTVTQYFGDAATGDLNGDGTPDAAFILTQSGGGSGTFFYIVASLNTPSGYQGTNGILLGDRIAPQSVEIASGTITVNYADRTTDQPMTAQPSVGVTKYFQVQNGTLVEVKDGQSQ